MLSTLPFFSPVKFDLGFIEIHGFGIMVALGLWIGTNMAMDKAKRDGLNPDIINRVVTWMIVGIFVGGHLGHVFLYEPFKLFGGMHDGIQYEPDPLYLLKVWDGLSSFGGFFITSLLCILFFRLENKKVQIQNRAARDAQEPLQYPVRTMHYGDCVIYGFPMAFGLGRVGCFLAHDHPGLESDFFLAVQGVCSNHFSNIAYSCHDLGLYEAIWALTLIPIVRWLDKSKPRFQGFFLAIIPMYYAPVRFSLDFLRTVDTRYYGLTPAQYGAMVIFSLGLAVFVMKYKSTPVRLITSGQAETKA
jgi:phosphatidylglycerol---prolipoprotein diacylglyceryl transferase